MCAKCSTDGPEVNPRGAPRPGAWAALLIALITVYRYTLSAFIGRTCRYLPTCSEYALTAIRKHGPWPGFWLALFRVSRCRPGGGSGFDPVPDDLPRHGWRFWRYRTASHPARDGA
jgi:hypothetical protein